MIRRNRQSRSGMIEQGIDEDIKRYVEKNRQTDKSKQRWSGGPITGDNTGVEVYDTIFAFDRWPIVTSPGSTP